MAFLSSYMKSPSVWPIILGIFALSVISVVGFAIGLATGIANPPQAKHLIWEDTKLLWADGTAQQPTQNDIVWHQSPAMLPAGGFSLEVAGTLHHADPHLSTWGIWIAIDSHKWIIIGINDFQMVTARYCTPPLTTPFVACEPAFEPTQGIATVWKSFNRIAPNNEENHIQIHYLPNQKPDRLTLRFGGEWMWDIAFNAPTDNLNWGVWAVNEQNSGGFHQWTSARIWSSISK